jgi:transcriptional regulator with XRE-family HTH domain
MFKSEHARELVEKSPFKRSVIAERCRVKPDTFTHYLNGHRNPPKAVIALLAIALGVPESELTSDDSEPKKIA